MNDLPKLVDPKFKYIVHKSLQACNKVKNKHYGGSNSNLGMIYDSKLDIGFKNRNLRVHKDDLRYIIKDEYNCFLLFTCDFHCPFWIFASGFY